MSKNGLRMVVHPNFDMTHLSDPSIIILTSPEHLAHLLDIIPMRGPLIDEVEAGGGFSILQQYLGCFTAATKTTPQQHNTLW